MARGGRRLDRGNIIGQRLALVLDELGRGSMQQLLDQLHHLGRTVPGYEELAELPFEALTRIKAGKRAVYDYEATAIAWALGVDVWWLCRLSDERSIPPHVQQIPPHDDENKT